MNHTWTESPHLSSDAKPHGPVLVPVLRVLIMAMLTGLAVSSNQLNWHSPVRTASTLVFILAVPGCAFAELLGTTDPVEICTIGPSASIALASLLSLVLLYLRSWSPTEAMAILGGVTVVMLGAALGRVIRSARGALR